MLEADEKLEATLKASKALDRDQRQRLAWYAMSGASYTVDTLFLALFAMAGTIPVFIAPVYGMAAASIVGAAYVATLRGWNLKLRDPSLVVPTLIPAVALQLGVVLAAPQVAFPFLANLFTVFSFGMIWMSLRHSVVVWTLGISGIAAVFYAVHGRIGVPDSSIFEATLVWLYFSLILARCLLLSVNANEMRGRLAVSREKLAATLRQVQLLASHDELTSSLNRRSLIAALEREHSRADRSGTTFSIALIDLDHFKRINDTHGHGVGDEVLRALAATVRDTMRATDVFGRYGGEEFLMILVGTAPAHAIEAMERIRVAVAGKNWTAIAQDLKVTMSVGIASHEKGETIEQLLNRADMALYQAKDAGRNTIVVSAQ